MPLSFDGAGTITGLQVGGLPDGTVDTDVLATDAVTAPKLGTNSFVSYAVICDQKANDTVGGTFTSGAWRTRDLNTELTDVDGIVSISSNQFTLGAGTYLICWSAPCYASNRHNTRLYDVTNTSSVKAGTSSYANQTNPSQSRSEGWHRLTITGNTTYEIQHRCQTDSGDSLGFGVDSGFGEVETYTVVQIYKEA